MGMKTSKCTFEKPVPGLFLYFALIPAVCIEIVSAYICIPIARVKTGDGVAALQDQKGRVGAFQTFFLHLSAETLVPVNACSPCLP